jgi:hypothetical protein
VCERCEVAARADRPPRRDERHDPGREDLEEQLDRLDARPGEALCKGIGAQEHGRTHDLVRVRVADPARMAPKESELEISGLFRRDRLRDEPPEAGVDAVGVVADLGLEEGAGRRGALPSGRPEDGRTPVDRDVPHVRDREVLPGQLDSGRHGASLDPPGAQVA